MEYTLKRVSLGNNMDIVKLFVPGRLCLFGEHSDWAGGYRRIDESIIPGYCLAIGTNQGINATVSPSDEFILRSADVNGKIIAAQRLQMDECELLKTAKAGSFFSYATGVAYCILRDYKVDGLLMNNMIDIPIKRGLSSSASICVLTARAFSKLYDLHLTRQQEMEYAYQGEILTGSECGRMDQICAYGSTPVFLTFDGDRMSVDELCPSRPIYMVIVDLCCGKNTRKILSDLNHHFMNGNSHLRDRLRYALGDANRDMLAMARRMLEQGDDAGLGNMMSEMQHLFDKYVAPACPDELTAPKLHEVLSCQEIQNLVYGGKGVGSQGDGCAQFIAKGYEEQEILVNIFQSMHLPSYKLTIKTNDTIGI